MKTFLMMFLISVLTVNTFAKEDNGKDFTVPANSKRPKYLLCEINDIVEAKTKLVYNKAKPQVVTTKVEPWGGFLNKPVEYEHLLTWKLNSKKTKPIVLEFDAEKIDILKPDAGPRKIINVKVTIQPSLVRYYITFPSALEKHSHYGFDFKADNNGNAVKIEYIVEDLNTGKIVKDSSFGSKSKLGISEDEADGYVHFGIPYILDDSDSLITILEGESDYPSSMISHIRYFLPGTDSPLGEGFGLSCELDERD